MSKLTTSSLALAAAVGVLTITACSSAAPTAVPQAYLQGTPLDRNPIGVAKRTEFLEIDIHPAASQLSLSDKARIRNFVADYRSVGHGPLIMSLPMSSANPQLAVQATAEAREIAWENGVAYEEIAGGTHGEESDVSEPLILAFQSYEAIAPDCPSLASLDMGDMSSNNELPTLGCAVRTNLAAMISDPGDLLGQRSLDQGDPVRRATILDKFRKGEVTGAERGENESGTVSTAVGN
ncbi:CpaD family pilus assembly protein [Hyphomonas sp.]|uniref:CpaD family pilus assembly protein n=1 Tax=Hyphomonas sp. TaxID=87 RepID=UPI0025C6C755|nr:CpaD family pilus assembly protein [Hyphomonas sp.]